MLRVIVFCALTLLAAAPLFFACGECPKVLHSPVQVETTCKLPPIPTLPTPQPVATLRDGTICFDAENAVQLKERDAMLKQWIRETIARCSEPSKSEAKDAGSSSPTD